METNRDKIRREWDAFLKMTGKQKLEHIWIYYRLAILVLLVVTAVMVSTVSSIRYNRREQLISGIFINNATSEEGYAHLREGYWEYRGGRKNARTELVESRFIDFAGQPLGEQDAANFMVVVSMISAKSLDYIITDPVSLQVFDEQEVVLDLRQLLPEEALAGRTIYESDTGVIAIGLDDTAFADEFGLQAPESCILVIRNTRSREETARFLEYLLAEG